MHMIKFGNNAEKTQKIKGAEKPTISFKGKQNTLTYEIKITASANVSFIEIIDGENKFSTNASNEVKPDLGQKEITFEHNFEKGKHDVKIVVQDVNGLKTEYSESIDLK